MEKHKKSGFTGIPFLNARLLLCSPVWLFGIFLILLFSCLILVYQEKSSPVEGKAKKDCIEWSLKEDEPSAALYERQISLYNGNVSNQLFSDNIYDEYLLLNDVRQYVKSCINYSDEISQLVDNAKMGMDFSYSTYKMKIRYQVTVNQYEKFIDNQVPFGNYLAWEKFFHMGIIEFAFLIMLVYTVYHMVILEREHGMNPLVHATVHGGFEYFFYKFAALIIAMTCLFFLLYGSKLLIYLGLYGSDTIINPVQSLSGYLTCPYDLRIWQYAVIYVIYLYFFWFFIVLVLLTVSSCPLSEAGICAAIIALMGAFWLITGNIHEYSSLIVLRNMNPLVLGNADYWFQTGHIVVIGKIGGLDLYLQQLQFPVLVISGYCLVLMLIGSLLYQRGLHTSNGKQGILSRLWNYRRHVFGNEFEFLAFQRKHLLIFITIILALLYFVDFEPDNNDNIRYEKSILTTLNSLSFDDACQWIYNKQEEFQQLHLSQTQLLGEFISGNIDENEYEMAASAINQQLVLEPLVEQFSKQADAMKVLISDYNIKNVSFAYQSVADQIYGDEGRNNRVFISLLISIYVILTALTVMPLDKGTGVNHMIGSTPFGKSAIHKRIILMSLLSALLAFIANSIWLYGIYCKYDWIGFNYAAQSWSRYREYRGSCTVLCTIEINLIYNSIKWGILTYFAAALTLFSKNAIWMEMLGIMCLIGPLTLDMIGITWIRKLPYIQFMVYGDGDIFLRLSSLLMVVLAALSGYVLMHFGRDRWAQ